MSLVEFKVGTSFNVPVTYAPVSGLAPADLANTTITSQLRDGTDRVIQEFTCTKAVGNMGFTVSAANGTHGWPWGCTATWDIRFVDSLFGEFYTETCQIKLTKPVTRG